jgi:hypothetical protein
LDTQEELLFLQTLRHAGMAIIDTRICGRCRPRPISSGTILKKTSVVLDWERRLRPILTIACHASISFAASL